MIWDFKRELTRKFIHLLSVFILFIYFLAAEMFNTKIALLILVFILIILLEFEYFRIEVGRDIPILGKLILYVRRDKEKERIGGDVFFLIGAIIVLSIFNMRVAIAAILMTIFGDLSAALIGKRFGKHYISRMEERAWEGIFAEFFVDLLIGFFVFFRSVFSNPLVIHDWKLWVIVIVMAITATFVETVIYKMDDNLLIPVFAGFNGQIAFLILNSRFF